MLKKILIGALTAIVVGAVGMSVYNAVAGSAAQTEAQPALASAGEGDGPVLQVANPGQVSPANSSAQADIQTAPGISAQLNAHPSQTPNVQAVQQGTGAGRGNGGNGRGNGGNGRGGNRWQGSNGNGTAGSYATPDPQNGFIEWLTFRGIVSGYAPPSFTLLSDDGEMISAQLGSQSYITSLGLTLNDGDTVTVKGYWDTSGSLAVGQIILDASGQAFVLRDDLGRPLWSGGPNR